MTYRTAEQKLKHLIRANPASMVLQKVVDCLYEDIEKYTWVGIYLVRGETLVLAAWRGTQATEHTTIPLGKGVCGAAVCTGTTELVNDVSKDKRYLSCFLSTRSEIVVPIKKTRVVLGEIDIDSDSPNAFDAGDVLFLEKVADMLSGHI